MRKSLILVIILIFSVFVFNTWAEGTKRVLILPFEIYAPQDLSYLKRAIPEMLTSRLFSPDKISVIESEKVEADLKSQGIVDKKTAQELGQRAKADFVIWGSISVLGEVVSIDAQIMDLSGDKKPAQFFQEVKGLSEIIPQLTRFSRKAKLYIEGKEEDFHREDLSLSYGNQGFVPGRMHPEKGYFGYVPYSPRPIKEEPVVEKAKPRFGDAGDPAYEGLTKDVVIDLSGAQPRIGIARERTNATYNATQPPPYLYYYPPQPYYQYSPPPYYYYQTPPADEGILSKIKRTLWPFGREEQKPVMPARPLYPQPLPVPQPLPAPQTTTSQAQTPISQPQSGKTISPAPSPMNYPPPPMPQTPTQQPQPIPQQIQPQGQPQGKDHPWKWQ